MGHPCEATFLVLGLFVVPSRDFAVVLEGLSMAPFKPQESASEKFLTLKEFFLLAIAKEQGICKPCQLPPPAWNLLLVESKLFSILGQIMSQRCLPQCHISVFL